MSALLALILCAAVHAEQEAPPLPSGLSPTKGKSENEPQLPAGLGKQKSKEEPSLPAGLGEKKAEEKEPDLPLGPAEEKESEEPESPPSARPFDLPFSLNGFWEARAGVRVQHDPFQKHASIGETRLQLEAEKQWPSAILTITSDFLYDPVLDDHDIDLERGDGWIELRKASLAFAPARFMDVKIGRQILTWGTGDLVFLNDLFPKDWNSFFIGRDLEYLKAPSDALKVSLFSDAANLDVVYTPRFDPDRFVDGRRISFWNENLGRRSGRDAVVRADIPDDWLSDEEIAARLYRNIRGYEIAAYGYRGFWKSPAGNDPATGKATFPDLSVLGAGVRGAVLNGIGNVETAYYHSSDDPGGTNPLIRNGEFRFLAGYEQEVAKNLTAGVQYYLEHILDHGDLTRNLPAGATRPDENRHVLTLRLTRLLMSQNLTLSLFAFYAPSDEDGYVRPRVHYKINDHWSAEAGGNLFFGVFENTFFAQFNRNTNVYAGVRYSF